ncbi:MAG: hypothetical protein Q9191_001781, partial [Dirinaria sp. TL-2023a]
MGPMESQAESICESDYDDDDYTSAGESTGTGRISGTSEFGDADTDSRSLADRDEATGTSGSPWSDFTKSKHVPKVDNLLEKESHESHKSVDGEFVVYEDTAAEEQQQQEIEELVTPVLPELETDRLREKFIPLPPEDCEAPTHPYRDPAQAFQSRLPFMTPIVEKTESSMGALTIREEKDYFNSKTPSRQHGDGSVGLHIEDELLSSPFQEIINEANTNRQRITERSPVKSTKSVDSTSKKITPPTARASEPAIKDAQCNPCDESIRETIIESLEPPLSAYAGFHDHRPTTFSKGPEIRKYVKALAKISKNNSDKTTTNLSLPPKITFPDSASDTYTIKRELGKGAFAPVYLAEQQSPSSSSETDEEPQTATQVVAVKCEHPPTPWEFYIMSTLRTRLAHSRAASSILIPYSIHLFADEGYLLERYLDQGTLLDLVNTAKTDAYAVLEESVAMFFTIELLRTVEAMHAAGVLHGDLKADNCLVRLLPPPPPTTHTASSTSSGAEDNSWDSQYHADGSRGWSSKGLTLIDFGRGIDLRAFRPDVRFIADWKTGKADCAEMREMRPWTYQVDYWGVAGVIHSLLFGKYIEDVPVNNMVDDDDDDDLLGGGGGG